MSENEKIRNLINKHKELLDVTDMDVCESVKGKWYFSRYNEEEGYYDCFVQFETANELAEMILGELALDFFLSIDGEPEEIQYPTVNFADDVQMKECYRPHIDRLIEYLNNEK